METVKTLLEACCALSKPEIVSYYDEIISNSEKFPIKFPINSVRCKTLKNTNPKDVLERNIASTYPIVHENVLVMMAKFLLHKRSHGTVKEKNLYGGMGIVDFVDRLLKKRSVMFCGNSDHYLLLTGEGGYLGWEKVGSDEEKPPLLLENCLSYDEMKLSALLYVSGLTVFINDGSRSNCGVPASPDTLEINGVIIGLIGTRLQKRNVMEFQEILLNKSQNSHTNGYGNEQETASKERTKWLWRQLWSNFYNVESLTFDDAIKIYKTQFKDETVDHRKDSYSGRFVFDCETLFDNVVYAKHIYMAFDCALLEASSRGESSGQMAYLHVVGIGLGVWRAFLHQGAVFVRTFIARLRLLIPKLKGVSDVHFSYFNDIPVDILPANLVIKCEDHPNGGINVHISNRQPSSKLQGAHAGKLLVETYAWDGNAQPGNEFWSGSLNTSGDPAAACSSQVAELHNSQINLRYVCGQNLHVAGTWGVRHVAEYAKLMLKHLSEE